jgi:hypothetical protein
MKRLAGVFLFAAITLSFAFAAPVPPRSQLRTNEYTWHPQTSPQGPVLVVISLPEQQAYTVHASKEEPQYLIKSDKIDHMAMHKGAALKKLSQKKPVSRR